MKRRGLSLIEMLVIVGVIAIVAAVAMPVFMRSRGPRRFSCQNNLKQLGLGFAQYSQDYDERMPLILVTPTSDTKITSYGDVSKLAFYGWADGIYPYVKNRMVFHCPNYKHPNGVPSAFEPLKRDCTDYWLNGRLAGQKLENIFAPAQTLQIGEGNDGGDMTDARYNYSAFPAPWLNDAESPLYRHIDCANYCFLDGHVKWLKPADISTESPKKAKVTFAIK